MQDRLRLTAIRVLPLLLLTIAAAAWFNDVQQGGPYVLRNLLPPAVLLRGGRALPPRRQRGQHFAPPG